MTRRIDPRLWRAVLPFLRPYRWQVVGASLSLILAAAVVLAFGADLRLLIDQGFASADERHIHFYIFLFFVGALVLAAGSACRYYLVSWIGERVIADIRKTLMDHLLALDAAYYETAQAGAAISVLTADTALVQSVIGSSVSVALRNIVMMVGAFVLLMVTSVKLTLFILALVPLVVLPILIFGRRVRALSRQSQDSLAQASAELAETVSAMRTVQAFGQERYEAEKFRRDNEDVFTFAVRRMRARALLTFAVIGLVAAAIGLVVWVGGHDAASGAMTKGQFTSFIFYAILLASSFGAIGEVFAELQRASGGLERILALLALKPSLPVPAAPRILPRPARGALKFEDVSFFYPARPDVPTLDSVSLDIRAGERIALVGPSGAGKSTILQLVQRFYDPRSGCIRFDGLDLRTIALEDLRSHIGVVPQDPVIFTGTVEENIRYGRRDAPETEIIRAARLAHAWEFINSIPGGLRAQLGERGIRLSGGQRQRLAIARAIVRNPALLLLDEATSALDSESEAAVQRALDEVMSGRTTIVIAHRLATILKADRIVVLDKGKIAAIGPHEELIRQNGLYTRLAELQFGLMSSSAPSLSRVK